MTLLEHFLDIFCCVYFRLRKYLHLKFIQLLCINGHDQNSSNVILFKDHQYLGILNQLPSIKLSHYQSLIKPKDIKPLWKVVNPRAINVLLIVIEKQTLSFEKVIMPTIAADKLVSFGHVKDAELLTGLSCYVNLTLVDSIAVGYWCDWWIDGVHVFRVFL